MNWTSISDSPVPDGTRESKVVLNSGRLGPGMRPALSWVGWAFAGAGAGAGVVAILSVGPFILAGTALLAAALAWRADRRLAAPGLLAGLALVPLYVGYLNRGGPGEVCTATASSQTCTQEMAPWPWLAIGLALAAAGAWLALRSRRRGAR